MKNVKLIILILSLGFVVSSCDKLKEEITIFRDNYIEIDATVLNAPATGKTFPLLVRVPQGGRPVIAAQDPLITRISGTIQLRVNLVAAQRNQAENLTYTVVADETTAEAGVHYQASGALQIPANSSFGFIEIQVLDPGATTGFKDLVVEIQSSTSLKANPNYNRVGLRIAQN